MLSSKSIFQFGVIYPNSPPSVDCDMRLSYSIFLTFVRVSDGKRVKVELEYHRTFNTQISDQLSDQSCIKV